MFKIFNLFVVCALFSIVSHASPVRERIPSDAEFIVVPLNNPNRHHMGDGEGIPGSISIPLGLPDSNFDSFDGVIDTEDFDDDGSSYYPSYSYFPSLSWRSFNSFLEDTLKTFRHRLANSWPFHDGLPTDVTKEGNTTSTVKVIDGHRVVINDTYYTKSNDFGTSVYKVRIVDVQPLDDAENNTEESNDGDGDAEHHVEEHHTEAPSVEQNSGEFDHHDDGEAEDTTHSEDEGNTHTEGPTAHSEENNDEEENASVENRNTDIDVQSIESSTVARHRDTELDSGEDGPMHHSNVDTDNEIDSLVGGGVDGENAEYANYESEVYDLLRGQHKDVKYTQKEEEEENRERIIVYDRINGQVNPMYQFHYHDDDDNRQVSQPEFSLSDDVRVNQFLADRGAMINPDAEIIPTNGKFPPQNPQFPQPDSQFPQQDSQFPQQDPQFSQFPQQSPQFPQFPQPNPQFPSQRPQFPQANPQFPSQRPQFPQANPQFPSQRPQFPQANPQFPSQRPQFPQAYPQFPSQRPQFPQANPQFPTANPQFPQFPQSNGQIPSQGSLPPYPQFPPRRPYFPFGRPIFPFPNTFVLNANGGDGLVLRDHSDIKRK